jgi:hypothetical protein
MENLLADLARLREQAARQEFNVFVPALEVALEQAVRIAPRRGEEICSKCEGKSSAFAISMSRCDVRCVFF